MTEFNKVLFITKAHTGSAIGPLSRLLVVFVAAMVSLASFTTVLAQQTASSSAQPHSAVGVRTGEDSAIRPFRINVPQATLDDLRWRIVGTKWPEREKALTSPRGNSRNSM